MIREMAKTAAQKKMREVLDPIADKLEHEIANGALARCEIDLSYDADNVNENYDSPHLAPHLSGYSNEIRLLCHAPQDANEILYNVIGTLPPEGIAINGVRLMYDDDAVCVSSTSFEPREEELEDRYVPTVAVAYITASIAVDED